MAKINCFEGNFDVAETQEKVRVCVGRIKAKVEVALMRFPFLVRRVTSRTTFIMFYDFILFIMLK
jgi:hypothetical protein